MIANTRIEPSAPPAFPPGNNFDASTPPSFLTNPHQQHHQPQPPPHVPYSSALGRQSMTPSPQTSTGGFGFNPNQNHSSSGSLNVPVVEYTVPGAVQSLRPLPMGPMQHPPLALRPMAQPTQAPTLNEVSLDEERTLVRCPYCQASVTTKISYTTGTMSHIAAMAVFVVCFPFFWIPYVTSCCKDVDHTCPNCGRMIGKFKRFT